MATLQEQIATAKAAGYSDADIAKHLSARADLAPKIKQATDAGYKPDQIVAHLSGAPVAPKASKPETSAFEDFGQAHVDALGAVNQAGINLAGGLVRGAGSIGATILSPVDAAARAMNKGSAVNVGGYDIVGQDRRTAMDAGLRTAGADPNSIMFKGGKLGAEIAGTAGAGGVVGQGIVRAAPVLARAGMSAPTIQQLSTAAATGGFRTGAAPGSISALANMGTRMAGGAMAGGAGAAMINPENAGMGAAIGAALPPVLAGAGKVAGYLGRSIYSLAQPFTSSGQERIAGKIINKFAEGGPTAVNSAQLVPGSAPTLAEATGNAGIAGLQRTARDIAPNRFIERETANAAARGAAFDDLAGDAGKLDFFRASRESAADDLYGQAAKVDVAANMTPSVKNQITQLLKRPSIVQAAKQAKEWALERGEKVGDTGSMRGLHDMKMALDDDISVAVRAGKGGQAKALIATKDKLLNVMERISPAYKEAKATYAEMSKPINQMEVLQGLRLTDAKGNMTLAKVQNAIDGLQKAAAAPGVRAQKDITAAQLGTLQTIRDDLLRQSNLAAGKSAGSNTFQNIATDNVMSTMLPGKIGEVVGGKVGGVTGQIGRLMYSGPNEAIRNRLADLMLDPKAAEAAMTAARQPILSGGAARSIRDLSNSAAPALYRAAPALSSSR